MKSNSTATKYCLYARKSSESDEKQAMSIKGQLMEMRQLAKQEKIKIIEEITESHSAKQTGQRPQFNYMVDCLRDGKYNAIITWSPDRISRNAGDLGKIIDLMDQGKLLFIRTHSQTFSNNPNEKFLLMILGSQAKLENDNRGINVKRGQRNKCKMGIRPGLAPIGYLNVMKSNRISSVIQDEEKAPIIKEMFMKVANQGYSGRMIKRWMDEQGFKTKRGGKMPLARIYATLKNPFYYGEFEFGGKWYKGSHKPLVSRYIWDKVQIQLEVVPKQWNKQVFPFKKNLKCGACGGNVTAEVKYRRLKNGTINTHIYYHCNRIQAYNCREPYMTEKEVIKQLVALVPEMKLDEEFLWREMEEEIKRFNHLKSLISGGSNIELTPHMTSTGSKIEKDESQMLRDYLLHILCYGTPQERLRILEGVKSKFYVKDRKLSLR